MRSFRQGKDSVISQQIPCSSAHFLYHAPEGTLIMMSNTINLVQSSIKAEQIYRQLIFDFDYSVRLPSHRIDSNRLQRPIT